MIFDKKKGSTNLLILTERSCKRPYLNPLKTHKKRVTKFQNYMLIGETEKKIQKLWVNFHTFSRISFGSSLSRGPLNRQQKDREETARGKERLRRRE